MNILELISELTPQESMAVKEILTALRDAKTKWPNWVIDPVHASAILAEEAGETVQASLDMVYGGKHSHDVAKEAAQTGAMAIRIIAGMPKYETVKRYIEDSENNSA